MYFSEEVEPTSVGALGWSSSGGQTIMQIEDRGAGIFRLSLDAALVDGDTLTLLGATDLAGNSAGTLLLTPSF